MSMGLAGAGASPLGGQISEKVIDDHLAVQAIIRSYQVRMSPFYYSEVLETGENLNPNITYEECDEIVQMLVLSVIEIFH